MLSNRLHGERHIICNNDGGDIGNGQAATPAGFLAARTTALSDSQVEAVSYCVHMGFNLCRYNTRIGEVFSGTDDRIHPINHTQDLIDSGRDCLQIITDFCHANMMKAYCSFRMNDCHDGKLVEIRPEFKKDNPQFLLASESESDSFITADKRWWSAVNYAVPEIRRRMLRLIEEVCENYDMDGIEMDFCRHTIYFREQLFGKNAEPEHVQMMTHFVREARQLTRRVSEKRDRDITVLARVPDAVDLCLRIGLDVENWLKQGLLDILVPGDYQHLTDWKQSVDMGHKYNTQVYPCISTTRIAGRAGDCGLDFTEFQDSIWRAEAMKIWDSGADGIYTFNLFNPNSELFQQIVDIDRLRKMDKVYAYASGPHFEKWFGKGMNKEYGQFPITVRVGQTEMIEFHVGEDVTEADLELCITLKEADEQDDIDLELNDIKLTGSRATQHPGSQGGEIYLESMPESGSINHGRNTIKIRPLSLAKSARKYIVFAGIQLTVRYQ